MCLCIDREVTKRVKRRQSPNMDQAMQRPPIPHGTTVQSENEAVRYVEVFQCADM